MNKLRALFTSRRFRQGGPAAVLAALFVAVMVLLNVVAAVLTERYHLRVDLTADQAFVLTDKSKEFLAALEEELTIYILLPEQNLASSGDYFMQANEVIKQYAALSDKVTVEYVDLTRNPGFAQEFPQYQLASSTILLESGGRTATLTIYDLFEIESDYSQNYYIVSSQAEQAMTSAMMSLTMPHPPTVSFLTGFGESGADEFKNLLSENRYTVVEQNLLTEEIADDASLVVISAPSRDYSEAALKKLDEYLYNGGLYGKSLLYFGSVTQGKTPNLNAFLAEWGISVDEGCVFQPDQNRLVVDSWYWSVVDYAEDHYAKEVLAAQLYAVVPEARPLTALFSQKGQRHVTELLTFDEGVLVADLTDEDWLPSDATRQGPLPAMLLSQQVGYNGDETVVSSVLVCGSERMMDPYLMQNPYVGNAEYLLAVAGDLVAREGLSIASKTIGGSYLMISEFHTALIAAVFVVVLPLFVLVTGGVVFLRRRHL